MSLIRKHGAVLQAWACLALVRPGNRSVVASLKVVCWVRSYSSYTSMILWICLLIMLLLNSLLMI